jgi:hypothetical protein
MTIEQFNSAEILKKKNWAEFTADLRTVTLLGDQTVFPYQHAEIESRLIHPDEVLPISKYVVESNLEMQRMLHQLLLKKHNLDTLDLGGDHTSLVFSVAGEEGEWVLSPPIVEESPIDGKPILLDGEHRFLMAKELNLPVRVAWIRNVPAEFPVVALPIQWNEVKKYETVPPLSEKRVYRYPRLEDFPDISQFSKAHITPENFLYFFYRDLTPVCTSSVRKVGSR